MCLTVHIAMGLIHKSTMPERHTSDYTQRKARGEHWWTQLSKLHRRRKKRKIWKSGDVGWWEPASTFQGWQSAGLSRCEPAGACRSTVGRPKETVPPGRRRCMFWSFRKCVMVLCPENVGWKGTESVSLALFLAFEALRFHYWFYNCLTGACSGSAWCKLALDISTLFDFLVASSCIIMYLTGEIYDISNFLWSTLAALGWL